MATQVIYQLAIPGEIERVGNNSERVHYRKEVARVGDWSTPGRVLSITGEVLQKIVDNFNLAKSRGVTVPVVWNHSYDARDRIGDVTNLEVLNDKLYAEFWAAKPADIESIGVTVNEVSAEIFEHWKDGGGQVYDYMLTHVGIVNLPVVPGQEKFERIQFSFERSEMPDAPNSNATEETQADNAGDTDETAGDDSTVAIVDLVVKLKEVFPKVKIPESVTTWKDLQIVFEMLKNDADKVDGEPDETTSDTVPDVAAPVMQQLSLIRKEMAETKAQLSLVVRERDANQKGFFEASVNRLVREGKLSPADKDGVMKAGKLAGYQLSLLSPYENIKTGLPTESAVPDTTNTNTTKDGKYYEELAAKAF